MDVASHTTAILLVFLSADQHETIEYIHIGLVVCHASFQLYKQKAIPWFIKYIEDDLKKARLKWAAGKDPGEVCSFSMFISNFGGLMAVPTDPPYYLVYPSISSKKFFLGTRIISTSQVALPGYAPVPAFAVPCSSMQTCLRPTGRNTTEAAW